MPQKPMWCLCNAGGCSIVAVRRLSRKCSNQDESYKAVDKLTEGMARNVFSSKVCVEPQRGCCTEELLCCEKNIFLDETIKIGSK